MSWRQTHIRIDITDFADGSAGQFFDIHPSGGGDFTANQHHTGFNIGLAGHAGFRILCQDSIKHGIGNLIRDFIRMSF